LHAKGLSPAGVVNAVGAENLNWSSGAEAHPVLEL